MKMAYKYLPESIIYIDINNKFSELWESVYNDRLKKHGDKKKAIISANAKVYSECFKMLINKD